ncbi:MAG: hypothetical protein AB7K24_25845, partial [Gemmataceae bacterium]
PVNVGRPVVNPNQPARGPAWFRKMDSNGDGDISPREFLGTEAEFARLDRDSDGLINLDEAEAVGKVSNKTEGEPVVLAKQEPVKAIAQAPVGGKIGQQFNDPPQQETYRSAEDLKKAGLDANLLAKQLKVDAIDFSKQMLVHVTGGTKNSGGFRVEITRIVRDDKAKTLTVYSKLHTPGAAATAAITHPGAMALIEKFEGTVKFATE